ncbi:unnamed protein product [Effrenium voratum]|uniref:Uncharacterized protein n=1 Tax=Effrenium voratum TaxID=2562239 RepID=A0AA36MZK0_9DINO|nr:unnamed protein product [Effrenium voratum]
MAVPKRRKEQKEEEAGPVKQRKLDGWCRSNSAPVLGVAELATPVRARSAPDLGQERSLRLKGTSRMEIRARKKAEVVLVPDSDEEPEPQRPKVLRISAGRAAAAAGVHCYADVGEMFLELLYQDLPELLLEDARLAGAELVAPDQERARLLAKSGEARHLEAALASAAKAPGVEAQKVARQALQEVVARAEKQRRLSETEAADLRQMLELEVNLTFGARHEDTALESYEARVGSRVYGQQLRVFAAMPAEGPDAALRYLPSPHENVRPREDGETKGGREKNKQKQDGPLPLFYLTGFVDALVDVPRGAAPPKGSTTLPPAQASETLVVEVKHRMGRIKDPPEIYDVVQLCSYCRVLGTARGDLVQCLRAKTGDVMHVTRIDFSEGSPDGMGFDKHVLPALYATARAVYEKRDDRAWRIQLLQASPEERRRLIGELCPHLDR